MIEVPSPTTNYKKYPMGWLSPEDKYYPCEGKVSHYMLACALLKKFHPAIYNKKLKTGCLDDVLQEQGYIRCGSTLSYNYGFIIWVHPTQGQVDAIWDYCQACRCTMPNMDVDL